MDGGVKSVLENGGRTALIATTDAALEREDYRNAEKLLDCYIRKTGLGERDQEWIKATERSIARLQSDAMAGSGAHVSQAVSPDNTFLPPGNSDSVRLEKQALAERSKTLAAQATPVNTVIAPSTNIQAIAPIPLKSEPTEFNAEFVAV